MSVSRIGQKQLQRFVSLCFRACHAARSLVSQNERISNSLFRSVDPYMTGMSIKESLRFFIAQFKHADGAGEGCYSSDLIHVIEAKSLEDCKDPLVYGTGG